MQATSFMASLVCLGIMTSATAEARTFEKFVETAPNNIVNATAAELADEIKNGDIGGISNPNEHPKPMYWVINLYGNKSYNTTWLVQLWQSTYCGSGGCDTFILSYNNKTKKTSRISDKDGILSERIAIETSTQRGLRVLTNWINPISTCAHVNWTGSVYKEATYKKYSYCKMVGRMATYTVHGPGKKSGN